MIMKNTNKLAETDISGWQALCFLQSLKSNVEHQTSQIPLVPHTSASINLDMPFPMRSVISAITL
jgi:hypothetical protein